jgi:hypothetical protein
MLREVQGGCRRDPPESSPFPKNYRTKLTEKHAPAMATTEISAVVKR